jgi:uncharacterized coiled-coil DUF342 family protein
MLKAAERFTLATPEARSRMIGDGYSAIAYRLRLLAQEVKDINQHLQQVPAQISQSNAILPDDLWRKQITEYAEAGDELSEAMIVNVQMLEGIEKAIKFYHNKNGIDVSRKKS